MKKIPPTLAINGEMFINSKSRKLCKLNCAMRVVTLIAKKAPTVTIK